MNAEIQETLRKELIDSRKGLGFAVFIACFLLLILLIRLIPGMEELMKAHDWPGVVLFFFSAGVGWIAGSIREDSLRREIWGYDDDTLKYKHDKMSRKKLQSNVIFYIGVALVVAYFVFKR